jgi:tetratricopeptide (TPR) repeat protein
VPPHGRLRYSLAAVVSLCVASAPTHADSGPTLAEYRAAVATYRHGDIEAVSGSIAGWDRGEMRKAALLAVADADSRFVEAAMMMHSDAAVRVSWDTAAAVVRELDLAESLMPALTAGGKGGSARRSDEVVGQIAAFRRHWYAFAASVHLAQTSPGTAADLLRRATRTFPDDAPLHVLMGTADEMRSHILWPDAHDPTAIAAMSTGPARTALVNATSSYRRALQLDPASTDAALHLGRALFLLREPATARPLLERAAADPNDEPTRYLGLLFLGALDEFEHRTADARRAYEAAIEAAPSLSTPYLALSALAFRSGDAAGARAAVAAMPSETGPDTVDPWHAWQNGGLDTDAYEWLRAQVVE